MTLLSTNASTSIAALALKSIVNTDDGGLQSARKHRGKQRPIAISTCNSS